MALGGGLRTAPALSPPLITIGPVRRSPPAKPGAQFPRLGGRREWLEGQRGRLVRSGRAGAAGTMPRGSHPPVASSSFSSSNVTQTAPPTARISARRGSLVEDGQHGPSGK